MDARGVNRPRGTTRKEVCVKNLLPQRAYGATKRQRRNHLISVAPWRRCGRKFPLGLRPMSFLDNLFQHPKHQTTDPRKPEEIEDTENIISPDTRREKRIPPGQSRTKKWPVLDAHGTPDIDLANWTFEVEGLVAN